MSNYGKTGGTVDINKRPQIDWKSLAEKAEAEKAQLQEKLQEYQLALRDANVISTQLQAKLDSLDNLKKGS